LCDTIDEGKDSKTVRILLRPKPLKKTKNKKTCKTILQGILCEWFGKFTLQDVGNKIGGIVVGS